MQHDLITKAGDVQERAHQQLFVRQKVWKLIFTLKKETNNSKTNNIQRKLLLMLMLMMMMMMMMKMQMEKGKLHCLLAT